MLDPATGGRPLAVAISLTDEEDSASWIEDAREYT